jgi:hypothetical protein
VADTSNQQTVVLASIYKGLNLNLDVVYDTLKSKGYLQVSREGDEIRAAKTLCVFETYCANTFPGIVTVHYIIKADSITAYIELSKKIEVVNTTTGSYTVTTIPYLATAGHHNGDRVEPITDYALRVLANDLGIEINTANIIHGIQGVNARYMLIFATPQLKGYYWGPWHAQYIINFNGQPIYASIILYIFSSYSRISSSTHVFIDGKQLEPEFFQTDGTGCYGYYIGPLDTSFVAIGGHVLSLRSLYATGSRFHFAVMVVVLYS